MAHKKHHHDAQDEADDLTVSRQLAPPSSDMNVTPLIDVLLVLLVIFMATLPLTQKGVDINLPLEVSSAPQKPQDNTQILVDLSPEGKITVNKQVIALADLEAHLRSVLEGRKDKTVFISGPVTARYGDMMALIDSGIGAGGRVAIVTEGMKGEAKGK